ncbi:MAG TPA: hypothetical protein VHC04_05590 [Rhodopila sp.]|nr:hypothetical protein [Rhodopila sp.]
MRALKIAVIVMGVLIILGTGGLLVGIMRKAGAPTQPLVPVAALPVGFNAVLPEPEGTRIAGIAAVADRLAVQLQGGGADRVVLVDPRTGVTAGRISLAR